MTREEVFALWNEVEIENPFPEGCDVKAYQAEHLNELKVAFANKLLQYRQWSPHGSR